MARRAGFHPACHGADADDSGRVAARRSTDLRPMAEVKVEEMPWPSPWAPFSARQQQSAQSTPVLRTRAWKAQPARAFVPLYSDPYSGSRLWRQIRCQTRYPARFWASAGAALAARRDRLQSLALCISFGHADQPIPPEATSLRQSRFG